MAVPISPRTITEILACGAVLPFAAFFAAYPVKGGGSKRKVVNVVSFAIGVLSIATLGIILVKLG